MEEKIQETKNNETIHKNTENVSKFTPKLTDIFVATISQDERFCGICLRDKPSVYSVCPDSSLFILPRKTELTKKNKHIATN